MRAMTILTAGIPTDRAKMILGGAFLGCVAIGLIVHAIRAWSVGALKLPKGFGLSQVTIRKDVRPFNFWLSTVSLFIFAIVLLYVAVMALLGMKTDGSSL
jgi:hypothetical protein